MIITGTNLQGATAVDFGAVAATITDDTGTQITATSPARTAGTRVDVTVTTPGGVSATSPDDQYTFIPAPAVTGLSVSQGPIGGGTNVTITGTNLAGGTVVVDFGTNPATISSDTGTQVVVTSPAGSVGAVDVTVTTAAGVSMKSSADLFTYSALQEPSITWPTPADITYGTALSGTQLDATANVQGTFTYTPAAGTVLGAGNDQTLSVSFAPTDTDRLHHGFGHGDDQRQASDSDDLWGRPGGYRLRHGLERNPARRDRQRAGDFHIHAAIGHRSGGRQ